jgi:hypothetical protein
MDFGKETIIIKGSRDLVDAFQLPVIPRRNIIPNN